MHLALEDSINIPNDAVISWDIGAIHNGQVMAYIKKADAEKQFIQQVLNAGGIKSYYEMYERGNYYYCFDNAFFRNFYCHNCTVFIGLYFYLTRH